MILNEHDYKAYLKAHLGLLHYSYCIKHRKVIGFNTFLDLPFSDKIESRNYFLSHDNLLEDYYSDKKDLDKADKGILNGFKNKISGDFVYFKQLKKHAIFLDTTNQKVYGVIALSDTMDSFFEYFPVIVQATIIPFQDKIIYDGFISSYPVRIGKNMNSEFEYLYKRAKTENKIITRLN